MKLFAIAVAALLVVGAVNPAGANPEAGQVTWAVHTTLVPTYFDPAETTSSRRSWFSTRCTTGS